MFDSPTGHKTVCLQKTLCYTLPPDTPKGSPATHDKSGSSPPHTFTSSGRVSPSSSQYGSPGDSKSPRSGSGKASPGFKTPPMRNLISGGSSSPHERPDSADQGSPDSQVRHRILLKPLPRDVRPGRNLTGSDRYRGILEQDHPEETLSRGFLGSCCCYLMPVIVLFLLMVTFLICFFGSPVWCFGSLFGGSDGCQKLNISHIRGELERGLIGQPVALNLIIDTLSATGDQESSKPLVVFFHGSSGVGKTHTANIIMESVLNSNQRDSCIHLFSLDLFLRSENTHQSKQRYTQVLQEWLNNSRSDYTCCVSFYIFDELRDDTPQDLTQVLGQTLSKLNSLTKQGNHIFIIMTAVGAQSISDFLSANMKRGHDRQSLTNLELNWQEPWKHLAASLDKQDPFRTWLPQADFIRIPFLPLERAHIKECARNILKRKNLIVTEEHLEWVADQLTYFPEEWPIFSASGCKKVSSKVDLIHFGSPQIKFDFKKPI